MALRLAKPGAVVRRAVERGTDGTTFVTTWVDVEDDDPEMDKTKRSTLPITLWRPECGGVNTHGPVSHLFSKVACPPGDVRVELNTTPPPTSQANVTLNVSTIQRLLDGEQPDLVQLFADIRDAFEQFVAFPPVGDARPEDYAAYFACYVISTYLLPAFNAVGYPWLTGQPGSGKSTVAHVASRLVCLPLMASANSTLASLRGHADAGGTLLLDNYDTVGGKDDATKYLRNFCEIGYMRGAVMTLQEPLPGRGWQTVQANVYANRLFTAVAEPPDALRSRCVAITMVRTDDLSKGALSPHDDENWGMPPDELAQTCWMVALHYLDDAANIVRMIGSAETGLSNRDLQVWRPVLTVARLLDLLDKEGRITESLLRLARWLLQVRAEDDGSREGFATRAVISLAEEGKVQVSAGEVLERIEALAQEADGDPFGLDNAHKVGKLLTRMGIPKGTRGKTRQYLLRPDVVKRLQSTFLPQLSVDMCDISDICDMSKEGVLDPQASADTQIHLVANDEHVGNDVNDEGVGWSLYDWPIPADAQTFAQFTQGAERCGAFDAADWERLFKVSLPSTVAVALVVMRRPEYAPLFAKEGEDDRVA